MPNAYTDEIAASGEAFQAEAIGSPPGRINVAIWNPYGSGKVLYLDEFIWSIGEEAPAGYGGVDERNIDNLTGFVPFDGGTPHWTNCAGDAGPAPKAKLYVKNGPAPNDYPYNYPHLETWTRFPRENQREVFVVPHIIQQGRGKSFNASNTFQLVTTFKWREKADPLGVVTDPGTPPPPPGAIVGTLIGDMVNPANAVDGNETTYANSNGDTLFVTLGIDLGAGNSSTLGRFIWKSPVGRSFCSSATPRALTWEHSYSADGTTYSAGPTGTGTDGAHGTQAILDKTLSGPSARFHKIKVITSPVADWRVAEASFYP